MPTITLGNPIEISSGMLSSLICKRNICIDKLYWHQPSTTSDSGVVLRKRTNGPIFHVMNVEVDGQSQVVSFDDGRFINDLYCECVGTGTLYIYMR